MTIDEQLVDATGRPIQVGQTYGYSSSSSGWSIVTIGTALYTKGNKVRLGNCMVTRYNADIVHRFRADEKPADVSMRAFMLFPIFET